MFRNLVVAALAVLALSSVGVGTAFAADETPDPSPAPVVDVGGVLNGNNTNVAGSDVTQSTSPSTTTTTRHHPFPPRTGADCPGDLFPNTPGCQRSGHMYGNRYYNDRFEGRYLSLDGYAGRLDVCGNYRDYNDFAGRYGTYRGRLDGLFGNGSKWNSIRQANNCSVSTQVVDNGDCTTYITSANNYTRYSNDWNRVSKDYRNRGIRLTLGSHELLNLQAIQRNRDYWKGDYDRNRSRVLSTHTTCDNAPVVNNITYEAPPVSYVAPAPATTVPAPVAPPVSTQLQAVPSGSANTGDGSTEK